MPPLFAIPTKKRLKYQLCLGHNTAFFYLMFVAGGQFYKWLSSTWLFNQNICKFVNWLSTWTGPLCIHLSNWKMQTLAKWPYLLKSVIEKLVREKDQNCDFVLWSLLPLTSIRYGKFCLLVISEKTDRKSILRGHIISSLKRRRSWFSLFQFVENEIPISTMTYSANEISTKICLSLATEYSDHRNCEIMVKIRIF